MLIPRGLEEIAPLTIRRAEENPSRGDRRRQGALANRGHRLEAGTVRKLLPSSHRAPAPHRRQAGMRWAHFVTRPWEVLAATAFFTGEVATWPGLVTYAGLVVRARATRQVQVAGMTPQPPDDFRRQGARQLTEPFAGCRRGNRCLSPDRGAQCTRAFDGGRKDRRGEPVLWPPRCPQLKAYGERFVRSLKDDALEQMRRLGARSRHDVVRQYRAHEHQERHHHGRRTRPIRPELGIEWRRGRMARRDRWGGWLRSYSRDAA